MSTSRKARPPTTVEQYVRHAQRFGLELVFETAAGLNEPQPLNNADLMTLARRLARIEPSFSPLRLDPWAVRQDPKLRARIERVFGSERSGKTTRHCVICGRVISGRIDRQTCSPAHQKRLQRRQATNRPQSV
jgi:hypothetical protein